MNLPMLPNISLTAVIRVNTHTPSSGKVCFESGDLESITAWQRGSARMVE